MNFTAPTVVPDGWPESLPNKADLAAHWGRSCFPTSRPQATALFTLQDLYEVLCDSRTTSEYVAVSTKEHRMAHATEYTVRDGSLSERVAAPTIGRLDLRRVEDFLSDGASLILYRVHEYNRALRHVCRMLQEATGRIAEAVVFLSPPSRGALPLHQDKVDVIVVQSSGTKHWRIFDPFDGQSEPGLVTVPEGVEPAHRLTLTPGDVCYMPAGRPHQARSSDDWSLHISITTRPIDPEWVIHEHLHRILPDLPKTRIYPGWDGSFGEQTSLEEAADIASRGIAQAHHKWRTSVTDTYGEQDRLAGVLGLREISR